VAAAPAAGATAAGQTARATARGRPRGADARGRPQNLIGPADQEIRHSRSAIGRRQFWPSATLARSESDRRVDQAATAPRPRRDRAAPRGTAARRTCPRRDPAAPRPRRAAPRARTAARRPPRAEPPRARAACPVARGQGAGPPVAPGTIGRSDQDSAVHARHVGRKWQLRPTRQLTCPILIGPVRSDPTTDAPHGPIRPADAPGRRSRKPGHAAGAPSGRPMRPGAAAASRATQPGPHQGRPDAPGRRSRSERRRRAPRRSRSRHAPLDPTGFSTSVLTAAPPDGRVGEGEWHRPAAIQVAIRSGRNCRSNELPLWPVVWMIVRRASSCPCRPVRRYRRDRPPCLEVRRTASRPSPASVGSGSSSTASSSRCPPRRTCRPPRTGRVEQRLHGRSPLLPSVSSRTWRGAGGPTPSATGRPTPPGDPPRPNPGRGPAAARGSPSVAVRGSSRTRVRILQRDAHWTAAGAEPMYERLATHHGSKKRALRAQSADLVGRAASAVVRRRPARRSWLVQPGARDRSVGSDSRGLLCLRGR